MKMKKISLHKNTYLVIYKLLHDALLLVLASFAGMLIVEGLLPGFVSSHISLDRVAISIFLILLAIVGIGNKFQITYPTPKIKRSKILPLLILSAFLLIGNSMLKFALWQNISITLITLFIFFLIYEMIFS